METWTNGGAPLEGRVEDVLEALERVHQQLEAMPPTVRQIDVRSSLWATLCARAIDGTFDAYSGATITIVIDNDLPMRTVRLHWSDGRIEEKRLDELGRAREEG
jgi:hypothetical protein